MNIIWKQRERLENINQNKTDQFTRYKTNDRPAKQMLQNVISMFASVVTFDTGQHIENINSNK